MIREEVEYFQIEVFGGEGIPANLFHQPAKDGLYISPAGRLCVAAAAMIESESIAERFAEALLPRLQKKHGNSIDLKVAKCPAWGPPYLIERTKKRIKEHTEKITNRLESNKR